MDLSGNRSDVSRSFSGPTLPGRLPSSRVYTHTLVRKNGGSRPRNQRPPDLRCETLCVEVLYSHYVQTQHGNRHTRVLYFSCISRPSSDLEISDSAKYIGGSGLSPVQRTLTNIVSCYTLSRLTLDLTLITVEISTRPDSWSLFILQEL